MRSPCLIPLIDLNSYKAFPFHNKRIRRVDIQCKMRWTIIERKPMSSRVSLTKSNFNLSLAFSRSFLLGIHPLFPFLSCRMENSWVIIMLSWLWCFGTKWTLSWPHQFIKKISCAIWYNHGNRFIKDLHKPICLKYFRHVASSNLGKRVRKVSFKSPIFEGTLERVRKVSFKPPNLPQAFSVISTNSLTLWHNRPRHPCSNYLDLSLQSNNIPIQTHQINAPIVWQIRVTNYHLMFLRSLGLVDL